MARHRPPLSLPALPLLALACLLLLAWPGAAGTYTRERRDFRALTAAQVAGIAALPPGELQAVDERHLGKLLVPRVSGSDNNTKVQQYIGSVFSDLGWHEDKYESTQKTPIGDVKFTNLVYTFNPDAPRKLVLSAHFDSKFFTEGGFIGATDSAAPCAFLIDTAEALTPLLKARDERVKAGTPLLTATLDEAEAAETTLQFVFFDGEEAFDTWTHEDSVYGSRALAEHWEDTYLPIEHPVAIAARRQSPIPTVLETIDVLVLLDLLGAKRPRIRSYFRETDWLFEEMKKADQSLRNAGLVDASDPAWFEEVRGFVGMMDDDHRPFLERGVPILHIISHPFPRVWHQMSDNADALDLPSMRRWARIVRVFTAGYLGLAHDDPPATGKRDELVRGE